MKKTGVLMVAVVVVVVALCLFAAPASTKEVVVVEGYDSPSSDVVVVAVPARDRRERSLGLLNNLMKVQSCSVSCEDPAYCCDAGYFCIRNALCLRGSPSDYEDAAFIGVGVIVGIIASAEHITLSSSCVNDVFNSVDTALRTFDDWDSGNRDEAMSDLRTLFGDLEETWNACRSAGNEPWWEKLINIAVKIVTDFFPEVKAVATGVEIIIHGENIYNDYQRMREYCVATMMRRESASPPSIDGSYADLVNCGIGIGDFGYEVYEILTDDEDDSNDDDHSDDEVVILPAPGASTATVTIYSDASCTSASGSVSAPLNTCTSLPTCPEPTCQQALSCLHTGTTLQELFTCLGCSTDTSPLTMTFTVDGSLIVESVFYQDAACGTPLQSGNVTINTCMPLSGDSACGSDGSVMFTVA